MAFTRTPAQDTYQTKQIPLIYEWNSRLASVDSVVDPKQTIAQNVYFELVENKNTGEGYYDVIKRDGVYEAASLANNILGMYYWEYMHRIVIVTAANILMYNPDTGTSSTTGTLDFSDADAARYGIGFTEFLYEDGRVELVIASSTKFGTFSNFGVWNVVSDVDRPTSLRTYPVFLDGYLFILGTNGTIYNSDLNNPYSWQASNFITVESYPDVTQAIARVGNYIVALGTTSTEWFYDAANPTGTPLAPVAGATQEIGYVQGLVASDNSVFFVGKSNRGTTSVYKIVGLKIVEVSSPTVRRWLNTTSIVPNSRGHIFSMGGHRFYVVVQNRDTLNPTQTYMLDLDNGMWSSLVLRQDTEGPFVFSSTTAQQVDLTTSYATTPTFFSEYGSSKLWNFAPYTHQDYTGTGSIINYTCEFKTRPLDFGNYRIKFCSRLVFGTDQTPSSSLMSVSWSDDDMQTYSTPRTFNVANVYTPLWACGSFRKRSFRLTYTDEFPMRWRSVEIDYNQGQA